MSEGRVWRSRLVGLGWVCVQRHDDAVNATHQSVSRQENAETDAAQVAVLFMSAR